MEAIVHQLPNIIAIDYILAHVILTWIVLYYFISKPTKRIKLITSAIAGVVLGVVWCIYSDYTIPVLVVSFLAGTGFYKWIKELLLDKLNIKYNDK